LNNSIKDKNLKEVKIQLKRAEIQKNILIENIYKEYEAYFKIVRKSIYPSVEKGIVGIYTDFSNRDSEFDSRELYIFLKKNISLFINSKLPLITIEQLKLGDIRDPIKQLENLNVLNKFVKSKEYQTVNFDHEYEVIVNESIEFHCNNNLNSYEYYESLSEDEITSVNLDESNYLNSFSKKISIKKTEDEKHTVKAVLELIEESNDNKLNNYEKINDQLSDVFISSDNLNIFEFIDKSFSNFLLNLSYKVNSELFKIKLIKKFISEDTFKCLSNNNYLIKHPNPFVIGYDSNEISAKSIKSSDIHLFNITNVELEFYNLDLSICRNNINELKNRLRLLNKKHRYWKNKELASISSK
jgi:hypothetical protein